MLLSVIIKAQDNSNISGDKTAKSYFNKVLYPNDKTKNYIFTFGYQYMLSPIGKTFGIQEWCRISELT
jgi:hypothetical protein